MSSTESILVTGGAGYIGSHFCKAAAERGLTPVTYDSLIYGHREAVRWGPFEEGDIRDHGRLLEVFKRHQPSAVVHFAALAYVGESVENPGLYYDNNVNGMLSLLNAMGDCGIGQMVFSSSCATYGIPDQVPIAETTAQRPISPYGETKLIGERMLAHYEVAHGLKWTALRYFNASGADPDCETGEDHDPETHLIPIALQAAQGLRPFLAIFGRDYDTPDGTCIRDYIHVCDLASAHLLALDRLRGGAPSAAFNLGLGRGFSVDEVVAAVRRVTGRDVAVEYQDRRPGDPPSLIADARLGQDVLGWQPRHTDLEGIVADAWRWQCQRFG